MNVGFYSYYETFNNNKMFADVSSPIGDNLMYPFVYLYETAKSRGINISTIDTQPLESYDIIFFTDFPTFKNEYFKKLIKLDFKNMNLLIFENKIVRPDNWDTKNYSYFKKIFTWNDHLVDNKKIFKFNLPNKIPKNIDFSLYKKEKLCTLIASNKYKNHPLELYSERIKAINWFEKNHPEDFDLYGVGWDKYLFKGHLSIINSLNFLNKYFKSNYTSYQGRIKSKFKVKQKYKFAICYENACDIPGYITEKIFDCFFAGCVPIYWGAPNITDHIPSNTFIDKREFSSYEDLYDYITNMTENQYDDYITAIKRFISSEKISNFSAERFAETILNELDML